MPHNPEAEKSLLGAIFVNNRAYETVSEFLKPEHFSFPQHGRIYEACAKLIDRGQIADPITLKRYFEADENLANIGGPAYLAELAGSAVTVINAGEYGHLVYDLFLKRELIALGEDVVNSAYGGEVDETATDLIEGAEQGLYELATASEVGLEIDFDALSIASETRRLCDEYNLDPLGVISSGALLIGCEAESAEDILDALNKEGIAATRIGTAREPTYGLQLRRNGDLSPLPSFPADEITRLFS
mgnify:CR=1 FL=1